jgi:hypothetical protein
MSGGELAKLKGQDVTLPTCDKEMIQAFDTDDEPPQMIIKFLSTKTTMPHSSKSRTAFRLSRDLSISVR